MLNNSEKVDMILIYGECNKHCREAARVYANRYPERYHPPHNFFLRLVNNLRTYGTFSIRDAQRQPLRNMEPNDDQKNEVIAYIQLNPHSSLRHVAREFGFSKKKVHKIFKKYKLHPYRADLVQHLRQGDDERRLTFIAWITTCINNDPLFLNYILWTDESKFTNNGVLNKQNNRYWSNGNPHWAVDTNYQTVWGTNVWCGLLGGHLIGPHFYDGTLNGRRYSDFLTLLPIMLEDVPLLLRQNLFFQQDGAPAHNAIIVRQQLNEMFGNRWMGTHGPVEWPPRSPDLTPLDFFLWGHLKTVIYADPPANLQDLKNKITVACRQLTKEQILAAPYREVSRRLELCLEKNGGNFEHFIR